jgi:hypothetical protein
LTSQEDEQVGSYEQTCPPNTVSYTLWTVHSNGLAVIHHYFSIISRYFAFANITLSTSIATRYCGPFHVLRFPYS